MSNSDSDSMPHTDAVPDPHVAQPRTPPHSPALDPHSTPVKAGASATQHAVDPPTDKTLRPVITGLDAMDAKLHEVSVETMFRDYIPGDDPPDSVAQRFHYSRNIASLSPEWQLIPLIVRSPVTTSMR